MEIIRRRLPIVAIVGRPNVGKSTLFNRITGGTKAVVHDTPGLTRDRNYLAAEWEGRDFMLVDTGGYETETEETIYRQMREQTMIAIDEADVIVFLVEFGDTMNPTDDQILNLLRRTRKPALIAVNKCDNRERRDIAVLDFARFGSDRVCGVSALHGNGTDELMDAVVAALPKQAEAEDDTNEGTRIAVAGRQNVGKSTLVNRILGFERTIANPIPGTTRDPVDTTFIREGKTYTLVDTAGIRRRGKVEPGIEKLSVLASIMSLQRCDIALIVLDSQQGITEQDAHVAGYAVDAGCGCIAVFNKWDLVEKDEKTAGEYVRALRDELKFLTYVPVIHVSAKSGQRVEKLFALIDEVDTEYRREIQTSHLNDFLQRTIHHVSPPVRSGKQLKIKYITQTGVRPPTFSLFVNDPKLVHFSYRRYLTNQFRREFGFKGVPIRLRFREKAEPRES